MLPDYHLHSSFSGDCETDVNLVIEKAISLGMKSICLTDHNDLDFPETPDNVRFDLDIDAYIDYLTGLKAMLGNFDLRIGVEQGLMPETIDKLADYSKLHKGIDFIICSTHVVKGMDPYYPELFEAYEEETVYRLYFEDILNTVSHFTDYNVYGHIDYVLRYGPSKGRNFSYQKYSDLFEEILKNIINNGKGIEINTGSLRKGLDYMHPNIYLLKMYKELGGEIITVGSDAHFADHVGHAFDRAEELLKSEGFKYYTEFRDMQPEFKPL